MAPSSDLQRVHDRLDGMFETLTEVKTDTKWMRETMPQQPCAALTEHIKKHDEAFARSWAFYARVGGVLVAAFLLGILTKMGLQLKGDYDASFDRNRIRIDHVDR